MGTQEESPERPAEKKCSAKKIWLIYVIFGSDFFLRKRRRHRAQLSKFCQVTKNAAGLTELVGKEGDVAIAESPPALRLGRLAPRSCYGDEDDNNNDKNTIGDGGSTAL